MPARPLFALAVLLVAGTATFAQEPKPADPKVEPKKEEPKIRGQLPPYWRMIGLTEDQVQQVYRLQAKYNDEIDVLEAKIKELKEKMSKERLEVLTPEQLKRLEEILKDKAGIGKDK